MSFSDEIATLKSSAENQLHALNTKEKTKNALLLPFVKALGYDIFNVEEVEPGFTIGDGEEGEETIDYAIKMDGTPSMLFEYKGAGTGLASYDPDKLFRHLRATEAQIGVLTNGIDYRFFADLEEENETQEPPFLFLEFNILENGNEDIEALRHLRKPSFDSDEVISAVRDLKYGELLQDYLERQWSKPSNEFVRFLAEQVYEGEVTERVRERFRPIAQKALQHFVNSKMKVHPNHDNDSVNNNVRGNDEHEENDPLEKNTLKKVFENM